MPEIQKIVIVFFVSLLLSAMHIAAGLLLQERKYPTPKTALLWGSAWLVLFLDFYISYSILPQSLRFPAAFLIGFLYFLAVFIHVSSDGFWKKCYLWVTYGCVFSISWCAAVYLRILVFPEIAEAYAYIMRCVFVLIICFPILFAYRKYGRPLIRDVSGFRSKHWRMLSIVSILYFLIFVCLSTKVRADDGFYAGTVFFFLVIVCSFAAANILIISNIYQMRKEAGDELGKQKVEYLYAYLKKVRENEEENRRLRHDMRHHDERIAAMAREGDSEGILRYLGHTGKQVENFTVWCPNVTVNSILSSFAGKAKEAGVEYAVQADTPEKSEIADVDFVAIIANLLENALKACIEIKSSGPVRANIRRVDKKLVIAVSNPCSAEFKIENGLPAERSIGIDSIVHSARRYHGEVNYSIRENVCTACVILNLYSQ